MSRQSFDEATDHTIRAMCALMLVQSDQGMTATYAATAGIPDRALRRVLTRAIVELNRLGWEPGMG